MWGWVDKVGVVAVRVGEGTPVPVGNFCGPRGPRDAREGRKEGDESRKP